MENLKRLNGGQRVRVPECGGTAANALGFDYHLIRGRCDFQFTGRAEPSAMFFGSAET